MACDTAEDPNEDGVFYCTDANGVVVDEDLCDDALADARVELKMHRWLIAHEKLKTEHEHAIIRRESSSGWQIGNGNTQVNRY
jgi:hypothetical protein